MPAKKKTTKTTSKSKAKSTQMLGARPRIAPMPLAVLMGVMVGVGGWLALHAFAATPAAPTGMTGSWKMVFNDEFDGTSLDKTKWVTCNPSFGANCAPWNNEKAAFTPNNVSVSNGALHLTAKTQDVTMKDASGNPKLFHYTSGMVATGPDKFGIAGSTYKGYKYTYGLYEGRAKVPKGDGLWPSMWMLPQEQEQRGGWPTSGEEDVFEIAGNDPTVVHMTEHDAQSGGAGNYEELKTVDMSQDYHVYGFDWEPDHLAWYIDGKLARKMICTDAYANAHPGSCNSYRNPDAIKNFAFYAIANLSVGGDWPPLNGAPASGAKVSAEMSIDWIRIWQHGTATPAPTKTPTPVAATPAPAPAAHGLKATYYSDVSYLKPVASRTDAQINFNWGTKAPVTGSPADNFSVRWNGQVTPTTTGTYTFYTNTDDGARLWVNGKLLVNASGSQSGGKEHSGTVALTAGKAYDVRMEYYENTGSALAKLSWSGPSVAKAVVPASALTPTVHHGLDAVYGSYDVKTGKAAALAGRVDPQVNFSWGASAPMGGVPADGFAAIWLGKLVPTVSGTYTIATQNDDGATVSIDGKTVISDWNSHAAKTNKATVNLTAGHSYALKVSYYDDKSTATMKLLWTPPGQAQAVIPSSVFLEN